MSGHDNNRMSSVRLSSLICPLSVVFLRLFSLGPSAVRGQQQSITKPQLVTDRYYGTPLGPLSSGGPATGYVFAPDQHTLFIKGFTFLGSKNPFSYFQAGPTIQPDGTGFTLTDEQGSFHHLGDYKNKDLILKLPEGRSIREIRWFSIWSRNNHLSMGYVLIPSDVELPQPLELPPLTSYAHDVRSGPITIIDAQTIFVPNFWYDGQGPAAYWWATRGSKQSPHGLRLKNEKGSVRPLLSYRGETVLLTLPDSKTIYDFDWLGIWCEEFQIDFGSVRIPQHTRVPPSPAMLGLKPETKLNCEVFDDARGFEMRWILDNDDIVIQLVGKILPHEYMSVGWGRDDTRSLMVGADAVVAWIDTQGQGHAEDYYLSGKEPCVGTRGSCPDLKYPGATDSVTLLHAAVVNGFRMITLKRPQLGVDEQYDQHIYSDGKQAVIWAYGPLNHRNEVSYHTNHQYGNRYIDFARSPQWNCPSPDQALMNQHKWQQLVVASTMTSAKSANQTNRDIRASSDSEILTTPLKYLLTTVPSMKTSTVSVVTTVPSTETTSKPHQYKVWNIPKIVCPKDKTFWAQMGPVGGIQRGYQAITGRHGWGIAWYINGLLIPELVLKRGTTYTFWVEGGNDQQNNARRHPLYITSSAEGGFEYKTNEERRHERVFAGVGITTNGTILPTAEGRHCEWRITSKTNINDIDGSYPRFEDFQRTLMLDCDPNGQPGMLRFTPDQSTPDLLYYQCYNHRYLGWKIHIVDKCPGEESTSESSSLGSVLQSADSIISAVKAEVLPTPMNRIQNLFQAKPMTSKRQNQMKVISQVRPISVEYPIQAPVSQLSPFASPKNNRLIPASSSSYMLSSLQNFGFFDPFVEQGLMIPALPLSSSTNPYTPFSIQSNYNFHSPNHLMMKKFGVRYPTTNHNNLSQQHLKSSSNRPLKLNRKTALPDIPVKMQSGGFVPMIQNKYNRIWSSLSKNKFNDILRIRPMDNATSTTKTTMSPTTTTTVPTTSTTVPATINENKTDHYESAESQNNRKIFASLEYSNGLLSDQEDDPEEIKLLQSSASSLVPISESKRNETDHTILSDVLRLIAHNIENYQSPTSLSLSKSKIQLR